MERNTILAVALSVLVLFTYQSIFQAPKTVKVSNSSQTIVSQQLASNNTTLPSVGNQESGTSTSGLDEATTSIINTTKSSLYFTNVGAVLHKIDFIKNKAFPLTQIGTINELNNVVYSQNQVDKNTLSFSYRDKNWLVTKVYEVKDPNVLNVRMDIKNISEISNLENFSFTVFEIDQSRMEINRNARDSALYEYSVESNHKIYRKGNAYKFNEKNNRNEIANVSWIGFRDHYNAVVIKPTFETKGYEVKADSDNQLNVSIVPVPINLAPGQSMTYGFAIYNGAQNPWLMKKYGQGFEKIVAFSNFPIIEWIAQAIYHIIPVLHGIFKSWGVAIILVSLMIYGITYPLTMQSMMSMRKMQEVQPKMAALKERYKDDPQKLNVEMMEIYRREKINPFGGCFPFLIQMPFFMALYQILWRAEYFQGQGFLWIKDLTQPDRLIILPFYLPLLGNELNILPIVTGFLMFVQQKVASKNVVVTDEQQATQQKMMMYILPVMMTCMFYKFASSWALYFFIFYTLSTFTQWKISQAKAKK